MVEVVVAGIDRGNTRMERDGPGSSYRRTNRRKERNVATPSQMDQEDARDGRNLSHALDLRSNAYWNTGLCERTGKRGHRCDPQTCKSIARRVRCRNERIPSLHQSILKTTKPTCIALRCRDSECHSSSTDTRLASYPHLRLPFRAAYQTADTRFYRFTTQFRHPTLWKCPTALPWYGERCIIISGALPKCNRQGAVDASTTMRARLVGQRFSTVLPSAKWA